MEKQIQSKPLYRSIEITREQVDAEKRTIELSFSSEEPVERYFGFEILDHSDSAVRFDRLNNKAPFLLNHDTRQQIGVIEKAYIGEGRRGKALVRFSRSELAEEIFQDVLDGIRVNVSVGYRIHKMVLQTEENGIETYRVVDWEPFEVSSVPVPADATVGVGRSDEPMNTITIENRSNNMPETKTEVREVTKEVPRELTAAERAEIQNNLKKEVVQGAREIFAIGDKYDMRDLAMQFVQDGKGIDEFRAEVLVKLGDAKPVKTDPKIGMNDKEIRQFSFMRALNALAAGKPELAGFEKEVSDAVAKRTGKVASGIFVPMDVLSHRDLTVGTVADGGNLVGEDFISSSFVEMLRNKMVVKAAGAKVLDGLVGDVAIPSQTGGVTTYWVAESGTITESKQAFGQLALTPHTLGGMTDISRKLLKQSSPSVEMLVRDDLAKGLAIAIDLAALHGTGDSNQPTGIAATSGIGSVAGGTDGLAPAWSHIVKLETEVAQDNADIGSLAYITNAKVRGKLKQVFINATYGEIPIWQLGKEAGVGMVNGYNAYVTNQVSSTLTKNSSVAVCSAIFFGNWADLIIGQWGGLDLTVDPYTGSSAGTLRIVALQDIDIAVRHVQSFAAMLDALTA